MTPHILMCPPDYYGIEYEINAWMSREKPADLLLAVSQWTDLKDKIVDAGAKVSLLPAVPGLPDMVFTANAALMFHCRAILARFRPEQRRGETPYVEQWLQSHAYQVESLPEEFAFEGAGDALFCGDTLFAGYRIRSDVRGHQKLGEVLGCPTIPVELVNPRYYHLDTCFCPLAQDAAIYYPPAFDSYGLKTIQSHVPKLIAVNDDEATQFACNAVVIGTTVITNTGCPQLHADLKAAGYTPIEAPLSEFLKAGGSAKCLTLRLDGEDAATWRTKPA
jgi:N-dimethylarginine dimethylaminohydrolase